MLLSSESQVRMFLSLLDLLMCISEGKKKPLKILILLCRVLVGV